ncbi:MAG TPA: nucleotidyltransferase family protein [Candidatus Sulfotelmatobacter sp.]
MKPIGPEDIVAFLGFSGSAIDSEKFENTSDKHWQRLLLWLDDSGLAFYFLEKLKGTNSTGLIPPGVRSRLEQDFAANGERTDYLRKRFSWLNRSFQDAGVRYAVLKGFSLVPQFCSDPSLRHQSDLDYLVDECSLPAAQQLLERAGYKLKPPISDQEFVYMLPNMGCPKRGRNYAPELHAIELHLDVWDSELNRLPAMERMFSVERASIQRMDGLSFPALSQEDAFLLQVLHTCRHLFTYWVRMSCLYEIGYFLTRQASDISLWNRVHDRVRDNLVLRELTVVVSEMAAQLFAAPVPELVRLWAEEVRSPIRVWIDHYARGCAFSDIPVHQFDVLPRSKLVLFLHQQFGQVCSRKHLVRNQLIMPTRLGRMRSAVWRDPSLLFSRQWWKRERIVSRCLFHLLSGIRYAVEMPRWRRRNRAQSRAASPNRPMDADVAANNYSG